MKPDWDKQPGPALVSFLIIGLKKGFERSYTVLTECLDFWLETWGRDMDVWKGVALIDDRFEQVGWGYLALSPLPKVRSPNLLGLALVFWVGNCLCCLWRSRLTL